MVPKSVGQVHVLVVPDLGRIRSEFFAWRVEVNITGRWARIEADINHAFRCEKKRMSAAIHRAEEYMSYPLIVAQNGEQER